MTYVTRGAQEFNPQALCSDRYGFESGFLQLVTLSFNKLI